MKFVFFLYHDDVSNFEGVIICCVFMVNFDWKFQKSMKRSTKETPKLDHVFLSRKIIILIVCFRMTTRVENLIETFS